MQPSQTTKSFTRLSRGMALIIGFLAGSAVDAAAFPTLQTGGAHQRLGVNLVDNRTYRHCHNGRRFVECYTRKFGQKDAVAPGRGGTRDRNPSPENGALHRHHHAHRDRRP